MSDPEYLRAAHEISMGNDSAPDDAMVKKAMDEARYAWLRGARADNPLGGAHSALVCLWDHVTALTAQLEGERTRAEEAIIERDCVHTDNYDRITELVADVERQTARADAAVAEANALREAAEQAYGYLWVTSAMVPKDDPVSLARKRLLDEIGGWNSAGQRRGIAFATDQFEVGPDGVRPKRATLAPPAADGGAT